MNIYQKIDKLNNIKRGFEVILKLTLEYHSYLKKRCKGDFKVIRA